VNSARVILAVEDNDDDFVLLRCAFETVGLPHKLIGVANGEEAINYLYAHEPFTNRSAYPFPDLMLLDLEMPVMDGFEVLAVVKGQPQFRWLPIVVWSSDGDPLSIQQAVNFGATDFFIKPITMQARIKMVRGLYSRWLSGETKPVIRGGNVNTWAVRPQADANL
jgi:CheY-like chemotaxis protein